jgi:coenzyme F420-0:L-glutamate ligase/coenzyme F420-1:gamma-L-glutamate ligase
MAAAGIDASNTEPGTVVLLPEDPDRSARGLRERLLVAAAANVAVVVSDTSGRAWRTGQTDIAVGCAGLRPLDDHCGRVDGYGNRLEVTAPATADEVAAAADLAKGKLSGRPVALLRGLAGLVLPCGEHGPGASALVREEAGDLFGYGARDAVLHAVLADDQGRGFGAPAPAGAVAEALGRVVGDRGTVTAVGDLVETLLVVPDPREAGRTEAAADAVARAHGWVPSRPTEEAAGAPAGAPGDPARSAYRPRRP